MLENHQSPIQSFSFTMTDSKSIDWNLIQNADPVFLRSPNGIDSMKLIAQQFLRTTTVPIENSNLILKLLQILQVIVGYLCTSHDNFAELLKKKEIENQKLKEIIENKSQDFIIGVQCPVCDKLFRSTYFLDKHFLKSHQNVANLWQGIRAPYPINQQPLFNNLFTEQIRQSPTESEDIQKTLKEIQKELKHKNHSKEKHFQQKFENRISDVENEIHKLKSISEPLLQLKTQVQPPAQQAPLLIQQQPIPQVLLQTIPVQRNVEVDPKIISKSNDVNINQTKNSSHHKHRSSAHKSSSQPTLIEQATSPFSKALPQNNVVHSDSYNTSSDSLIEEIKVPVVKNSTQNKKENQNQNANSNKEKQNFNSSKKVQNIQNIDKPNLNDNKTKKKIKKKIKPTINTNSIEPVVNQNQNQNCQTNQQKIKNSNQNNKISEKNSKKNKAKSNVQDLNVNSNNTVTQNKNNFAVQKTETLNSNQNLVKTFQQNPQARRPSIIVPDTASDDENQGEIDVGIIKRNDYPVVNYDNKAISQNKNINAQYMSSESEITIQVKKNVLVSPQNTFSTNQNIPENNEEYQIRIPTRTQTTTTTKCVKSLPTQSPIGSLNSSIPSISSDIGSPYNTRTRNKSLLQEMTSESDSKLNLAFDKK